ncbi:cation:proton antiporter [Clostridium chauvoei]|uniref:Cation:proton antiporter n=2 Tax=Clostridium chauvoei TaxID=46867 RepID=A0ABD4RHE9_9CLOT|nr:cation:proton antiporter [Clostridium chauvoei]ATD55306.1 toxin PIN [Clostridium chauvoei]ATD57019.1 toxin PIN [Clostridium chauvoei]MBX7280818.1 cation:proton antiporter [Clostridium chauvoei]MBX7283301.1 cation:proton antiporter [Clostridium chauvoei]MBX7285775.1 cation:proton antiporter [Clostridium chauvoei]
MTFLISILSLIIIGVLASYSGKLVEKIKLPSLIGMMIIGMVIGPTFLNLVPVEVINISPIIKDIALVTVLFIGGLGISLSQMKEIGRPAILLSIIPATLEGLTIAFLSTYLLDFTFIQGAILGFIIAAVSPAVLVPSMISLIDRKLGEDKAIPQMLLVGASADDTIAITLFTTFLGVYVQGLDGKNISIMKQISMIPITIGLSIFIGWFLAKITTYLLKYINRKSIKVLFAYALCIAMRVIEKKFEIQLFNSLLTIMIYGFFLRNYVEEVSRDIIKVMNKIWSIGKIYLFAFVGMAINPSLVGEFFVIGIVLLIFSLSIRSIGVLISLLGTNLNKKEKLFCIIAYLPKATVQSAKAGIPLQMGVVGGEIMQAIAILSVLITAPIGAIGIKLTSGKWLSKGQKMITIKINI